MQTRLMTIFASLVLCGCVASSAPEVRIGAPAPAPDAANYRSMGQILEDSQASDWFRPSPENLMYVELDSGTVIIHLAERFAPRHVANIRTLVNQGYFDGLVILRSQENYVVQWGDPADEGSAQVRSLGAAQPRLAGEYYSSGRRAVVTPLGSRDAYAPIAGFAYGYPVGLDADASRIWLTHCYGMVGVGRGMEADSGNGSSLYVVIGHAPRHLDRNVTLVGRVLQGMELLTTLPRGTGALGFYEDPSQHVPIRRVRLASEMPPSERVPLEVLRTDTKTFADLIESRRYRREDWFLDPVGEVGLCNVPLPVRRADAD